MNTSWNINYSLDGNLIIEAKEDKKIVDLFGSKNYSLFLAVDSHYLYELKNSLQALYPQINLSNRHALKQLLSDEFFTKHGLLDFKSFLESVQLPFRFYNSAA